MPVEDKQSPGRERNNFQSPFPSTRKGNTVIVKRVLKDLTYGIYIIQLVENYYTIIPYFSIAHDYINNLLQEMVQIVEGETVPEDVPAAPSPLCSGYMRPDKEAAIRAHKTRFQL